MESSGVQWSPYGLWGGLQSTVSMLKIGSVEYGYEEYIDELQSLNIFAIMISHETHNQGSARELPFFNLLFDVFWKLGFRHPNCPITVTKYSNSKCLRTHFSLTSAGAPSLFHRSTILSASSSCSSSMFWWTSVTALWYLLM